MPQKKKSRQNKCGFEQKAQLLKEMTLSLHGTTLMILEGGGGDQDELVWPARCMVLEVKVQSCLVLR